MSETAYKSVEIQNGTLVPLKKLKLKMEDLNRPRQKFPKTYSPNGVIDIYRKICDKREKIIRQKS